MKLLRELVEEVEFVTEGTGEEKRYFIEGPFLQADITNRNKRLYPMSIMEPEVERYTNESVNTNSAWGELNHPNGPTINLDRVSHRTIKLERHGSNFEGKALIVTANPMGQIVRGLQESGGRLGVSSRGLGTLKLRNGINEVQKDFHLATAADIVADPSAPDAYVTAIMEGVDWVNINGTWEMVEQHKETIKKSSIKTINEIKLVLFQDFLESIV